MNLDGGSFPKPPNQGRQGKILGGIGTIRLCIPFSGHCHLYPWVPWGMYQSKGLVPDSMFYGIRTEYFVDIPCTVCGREMFAILNSCARRVCMASCAEYVDCIEPIIFQIHMFLSESRVYHIR